jgi:hypothetical protein
MSQLPTWISTQIIKLLGELYQELLIQQPYGMLTFSTFGLNVQDNDGQQTHISLLDLISQPGFIEDIVTIIFNNSVIDESFKNSRKYENLQK